MSSQNSSTRDEPFLRAEGLGMTFPGGYSALRDVTFSLGKGEFVALVGPSGCGKSTLLRLIAGLLAPTRGSLLMAGVPASETIHRERRLGFVFQDHRLLSWRDTMENIRLPMELGGMARAIQDERIAKNLQLVGLSHADAKKYPHMLSGGMRMRVSLARTLAMAPELLLLDEPFGALDDFLRQQLNEELSGIWLRQRWTAVFVTHNVSEAVFLSQRILVMTPAAGTIVHEIPVPFDYPRSGRLRTDEAFARLAGEVSARLREGGG